MGFGAIAEMMILLVILGGVALLYVILPLLVLLILYFLISKLNRHCFRTRQKCLDSTHLAQRSQIPLHIRIFGTKLWNKSETIAYCLVLECALAIMLFSLDSMLRVQWHSGYERYKELCQIAEGQLDSPLQDSPQKYSQIFKLKHLFYSTQFNRLDENEKEALYLGQFQFSPKAISEKEFLSYLDPNKPTYPPKGNPTLYSWEFTGSESEQEAESSVLQRLLFGSSIISYTLYVSSHSPNITSMQDIKTMRFGVKWEYRTLLHTYFVGILSNANKGVQTCGHILIAKAL